MTEYERGYADGSLSVTSQIAHVVLDKYITELIKHAYNDDDVQIICMDEYGLRRIAEEVEGIALPVGELRNIDQYKQMIKERKA